MLIQGPDGMCGNPHLQVATSLNPTPIIPVAANVMACLQFRRIFISDKAVKTVKNVMIVQIYGVYSNIYTYGI